MSDAAGRLRDRDGLGDRAEQRALRGVEHAARIELDDDAEHVVVLQQIWKLLERCGDPGEVERIGTQPANTRTSPSGVDAPFSSFTVSDSLRPPGSVQMPRWITFPAASRCKTSNRKVKRISSSAG